MSVSARRALAICRILLGIAVVMNALEVAVVMFRVESGQLGMPSVLGAVPVTDTSIGIWTVGSVCAGLLMACGAGTSLAAASAAGLGAFALLWDQQNYSNHFLLTTLLVAILTFARSDAAWSVRTALRRPVLEPRQLPTLLMATQLSTCYVFAGLSKLNPWWIAGDELVTNMRLDLPLPAISYPVLAVVVISTELFIGIGMWFRRLRPAALFLGVMLHLGIVTLMREPLPLVTFAAVCLGVYPVIRHLPYARDIGPMLVQLEAQPSLPPRLAQQVPRPRPSSSVH